MSSDAPGKPLLDDRELFQRFFRNRERFHQDADVPELLRNHVYIAFFLHYKLGHVAVALLDSALGKVAGIAKVLAAATAGEARGMRAGTADSQHHQVAWLCFGYFAAGLGDLTERFVADDQMVAAVGRRSVLEGNDLAIGAAHAHLEDAQFYLGRRRYAGFRMIDEADLALARENSHRLHTFRIPRHFSLD